MKVLLAEDSATTRRMIQATIEACGHEVIAVADGEAAWEKFETLRPAIVVLDWHMPLVDGIEVCRRIRAASPEGGVMVLMVTHRDQPGDLTSALDAGVDDYLMKPVSAEQLRARIMVAERRLEEVAVRRRVEAALAHAQWLAGIGETTLTLQHEINNPLLALTLAAALLNDSGPLSEEQRTHSAVVVQQARRIADVVKRLAQLENPRSIEYLRGRRMLDLSAEPGIGT